MDTSKKFSLVELCTEGVVTGSSRGTGNCEIVESAGEKCSSNVATIGGKNETHLNDSFFNVLIEVRSAWGKIAIASANSVDVF